MGIAAVWACVRIISEDIAKLPLILYRRLPNGGKERAVDHPLYTLMHDAPNAMQTSFEWREVMTCSTELRGNSYAMKVKVRGQLRELLPVPATDVTVRRDSDWEPRYKIGSREYGRADVFHHRGLSLDGGLTGASTITLHRESFGLSLATLQHGARVFGNGARPSGILEAPNGMSDDAARRLKSSVEAAAGGQNMHRLIVLEEGVKWAQVGLSNEDAQYLETRGFQRTEACAIFRIPPHKIAHLDDANYSNVEQMEQAYVNDALMSRLARWEQRLNLDLLTPAERGEYFFEFLVDGLLRGDSAARYAAHQIAFLNGIKSRNEIRAQENMNPVEGGDDYRIPANTLPATGESPAEDRA